MLGWGSRTCGKCKDRELKKIVGVTRYSKKGLPLEYELECGHKARAV
jgi:hypothetical protein